MARNNETQKQELGQVGTDGTNGTVGTPVVEQQDQQGQQAQVEVKETKLAFAEKAALIAKNYGVKKVWGTVDGRNWATSEENMKWLPNGAEVEEYTFEE